MAHAVHDHAGVTTLVDDCWNHVGTYGDQSCPRLTTYSHCLNCPIFEEGAVALLDHALNDADLGAAAQAHRMIVPPWALGHASAGLVVLVFRITDGWLALLVAALQRVDMLCAIHTLPYRRNRMVLRLINIRGAPIVAVSLDGLLGLDRTGSKYAGRGDYVRLLVTARRGELAVFPIDEVEDALRFPVTALLPVPSTLAHVITAHARGVLAQRDVTIGLLGTDRVSDSIARNLR